MGDHPTKLPGKQVARVTETWMPVSGTFRRYALEDHVAARYFLSPRAAAGILRRAEKRGRELPQHLADALRHVSTTKEAGNS